MIFLFIFLNILSSSSAEEKRIKQITSTHDASISKICEILDLAPFADAFSIKKSINKFLISSKSVLGIRFLSKLANHGIPLKTGFKNLNFINISNGNLSTVLPVSQNGTVKLLSAPLTDSDYPVLLSFGIKGRNVKLLFDLPNLSIINIDGNSFSVKSNSVYKISLKNNKNHFVSVFIKQPPLRNPWIAVSKSSQQSVYNPESFIPPALTPRNILDKNLHITDYGYPKNACSSNSYNIKSSSNIKSSKKYRMHSLFLKKWKAYNIAISEGDYLKKNYRCKAAQTSWLKAETLLKNGIKAKLRLISSLGFKGLYLTSLKKIQKISYKYPNIPAIYELQATFAAGAGLNPGTYHKKLLSLYPHNPEYAYLYAEDLVKEGKTPEARKLLYSTWLKTGDFFILKTLFSFSDKNDEFKITDKFLRAHLKQAPASHFNRAGVFHKLIKKYSLKINLSKINRTIEEKGKILLDDYIIYMDKNRLAHAFHHHIFMVGQNKANRNFKYKLSFYYTPDIQIYKTLNADVYGKDGKIRKFYGSIKNIELNFPNARTFFDVRRTEYEFNNLKPGDIVDIKYIKEELPEAENRVGRFAFGAYLPFEPDIKTEKLRVLLFVPEKHKIHPIATPAKLFSTKNFVFHNLKATEFSTIINPSDFSGNQKPAVYISFNESWKNLGKLYSNYIKPNYIHNKKLKKLTLKLIGNSKTDQEKIQKIHTFVLKHFRYVSLMFGLHGYIPYTVNEILLRKFGDCKDMTLLLVKMFEYAGIKAVPALVKTAYNGDFPTNIPSLAPFDHSIVYLPSKNQWVDTTTKGLKYPLIPWHIQGRYALVINGNQSSLKKIPEDSPQTNHVIQNVKLILKRKSKKLKINISVKGQREDPWRKMLGNKSHSRLRFSTWIKRIFPGRKILKYKDYGLETLDSPLKISSEIKIRKRFSVRNGKIIIPLDFGWKKLFSLMLRNYVKNKVVRFPFREILELNFKVKFSDKKIRKTGLNNLEISTPWFDFSQEFSSGKGFVKIKRLFKIKKRKITSNQYENFKSNFEKMLSVIALPLVTQKNGR